MVLGAKRNVSHLLTKYQHPAAARRDIEDVLKQYGGLDPSLETFVFDDGRETEMVKLSGTIPVTYKNNVYHTPVCLWILDTYPYNPPLCYAQPTNNMRIKVSKFVDHNGKIYLPYLYNWTPNQSDLMGVVQVMIVIFGENPPLFTVPPSTASSNTVPYPVQQSSYMPMPGQTPGPMPPYPPVNHQSPLFGGNTPYPSYPPASLPAMTPSYPPYNSGPASSIPLTGTITEQHLRDSMQSAVEDKIRLKLQEMTAGYQAEIDSLKNTSTELIRGRAKLEQLIERITREQVEVERNSQMLSHKADEIEATISKLESQEPIDIDEAVTTTAPLYKQMLELFAEEAATEDIIYYLGEALRKSIIELDVFLKHVRNISGKQFKLRALMQKCSERAGLS